MARVGLLACNSAGRFKNRLSQRALKRRGRIAALRSTFTIISLVVNFGGIIVTIKATRPACQLAHLFSVLGKREGEDIEGRREDKAEATRLG